MTLLSFSRGQMIRDASLTEADLVEVVKCRRDHNRLGFAYQIGFARLFNRFPAQQPLEMCDELLSFVATQLNIDTTGIDEYASRQHTVSDHQTRIRDYMKLVVFDSEHADALERFVFEESCRLEQTASLLTRAREFLKERRVLFPADSVLLRLVGEQKKQAREHIAAKLVGSLSPAVVKVLDDMLEVKEGEAISSLQAIKANPAKPSPAAMQSLADKITAIEATGVLKVDLSWLSANYQRALFHYPGLFKPGQTRRPPTASNVLIHGTLSANPEALYEFTLCSALVIRFLALASCRNRGLLGSVDQRCRVVAGSATRPAV